MQPNAGHPTHRLDLGVPAPPITRMSHALDEQIPPKMSPWCNRKDLFPPFHHADPFPHHLEGQGDIAGAGGQGDATCSHCAPSVPA